MNKRTINRRPLKVFCDRCWVCVHFCLISSWQDVDQQILSLLPWNVGQGLWLGQVFSSLLCDPNSNPVPAPPSGNCQRAFSSPLPPPFISLLALGKLPDLSDIIGSHDPWFAPQVSHHPIFSLALPTTPVGNLPLSQPWVLVLVSCSAGSP